MRAYSARIVGAALLALGILAAGCEQAPATVLWKRTSWSGVPNLPPQAAAGRPVLYVSFDLTGLRSQPNDRTVLPVPDGSAIVLVKTRSTRTQSGGYVWQGKVEGDDESIATLVIERDTLVGSASTSSGRVYRIGQVAPQTQVIFVIDPGAYPQEAQPLYVDVDSEGVPDTQESADCHPDQIEMLALYTDAACSLSFSGGPLSQCTPEARDEIVGKIRKAEEQTNTIFSESLATPQIRILSVEAAGGYVEAETISDDLEQLLERDLVNGVAPPLLGAHSRRNQLGADTVSLITRPTNAYPTPQKCGKSTLMSVKDPIFEKYAFSVVPADCIEDSFSFAHELGHLLGADHDSDGNRLPSQIPNNRAFVMANPQGETDPWRTVMAENSNACTASKKDIGCIRLPYFSNPNPMLKHGGQLMGAAERNNAFVVSDTAGAVADYRPSLSCSEG